MPKFYLPNFRFAKKKVYLIPRTYKILIQLVIFLIVFMTGFDEFQKTISPYNEVFLVKNTFSKTGKAVNKPVFLTTKEVYATRSAQYRQKQSQIKELQMGIQQNTSAKQNANPQPAESGSEEWGKAKQLDEHTWTVKLQDDTRMSSAQELLEALNAYRQKQGRGALSWDSKLADYAQQRADFFRSQNNLDSHKGFMDYVNNQDGFTKLGFAGLGENSSIGYTMEGVHLIEWVFAADEGHNNNQLSSNWSYVGIGVNGTATDLVFGGSKL